MGLSISSLRHGPLAAITVSLSHTAAVIPGFYGVLPDGSIHTFSRGGSDITGALAAAALESARAGGEELSSLRAGDLTVTKRSSDEGSKRLSLLREQAWALMRPYTTDGGFCFRGVET